MTADKRSETKMTVDKMTAIVIVDKHKNQFSLKLGLALQFCR